MEWIDGDPHLGEILVDATRLQVRVQELANEISTDFEGRAPLLIGVLKGAFMFMSDLAKHIRLPVEFDFMAVSSYGSATKTSGVVRILKDLEIDIQGRDVIVVEDIVESGLTLQYLLRNLKARNPATLTVCSLLWKEGLQSTVLDVPYIGFSLPPDFVVGYGLDVAERYRNLPFIAKYIESPSGE
jgi:hypoxanthine phosphoribosyltransferase